MSETNKDSMRPGQFVTLRPTRYAMQHAEEHDNIDKEIIQNAGLGLFMVLESDRDGGPKNQPYAWYLYYISGNRFAAGELPDDKNQVVVLQECDPYCSIDLAVDPDDTAGIEMLHRRVQLSEKELQS